MFYKQYMVSHEIDRCTRWHASCEIPDRFDHTLIDAIDVTWVSIHGPPETLVIDGETGLAQSAKAKAYFQRHTTQLKVRAPQQHARFIERRGAILRHQMHLIEEQCKRENLQITFKQLLSESTFCGNALTFVGNSSPYNALYGRTPKCLPDVPYTEDDMEASQRLPENERVQQRIREIAVQSMVSTTAAARMTRALKSNTAPTVEYKVGDMVDYFREASSKDTSGWHGPERIIKVKQSDGQIVLRLNGKEYPCRLQALSYIHSSLESMTWRRSCPSCNNACFEDEVRSL